jgi:hypothetical protein
MYCSGILQLIQLWTRPETLCRNLFYGLEMTDMACFRYLSKAPFLDALSDRGVLIAVNSPQAVKGSMAAKCKSLTFRPHDQLIQTNISALNVIVRSTADSRMSDYMEHRLASAHRWLTQVSLIFDHFGQVVKDRLKQMGACLNDGMDILIQ